jgi:hypothetical protein
VDQGFYDNKRFDLRDYLEYKENIGLLQDLQTTWGDTYAKQSDYLCKFKTFWGTYRQIIIPEFKRMCEELGLRYHDKISLSDFRNCYTPLPENLPISPDAWLAIIITVFP